MAKESQQWDLLLAQNVSAANHLSQSLNFHGPVKVMENPRNRRLYESLRSSNTLRRSLDIDANACVIMYAPTWRHENLARAILSRNRLSDLIELADRLGSILVVRAHHLTTPAQDTSKNVREVSQMPHVEDVMAMADLLVTDYSSIVFDFLLTGRPIVLDHQDIDDYREEQGIYEASGLPQGAVKVADNNAEMLNAVQTFVTQSDSKDSEERDIVYEEYQRQQLNELQSDIVNWAVMNSEDATSGFEPRWNHG